LAFENKVVMMKANMIMVRPNSNMRINKRKKFPLSKMTKVIKRAPIIEIITTITE
jgi:hypothetical protein